MPQYIYGDVNGHRKELEMSFTDAERAVVLCDECECVMHRVPQAFAVNWGGLPPHKADARPPQMQNFINSAPERRAQYLDSERKK